MSPVQPVSRKASEPALKVSDEPAGSAETGGRRRRNSADRAALRRLASARSSNACERRQETDTRSRRNENTTTCSRPPKRLEDKVTKLKDAKGASNAAMERADKVEPERFKGIVTMYETSKAKDAAEVLRPPRHEDPRELFNRFQPRNREILAQMSPDDHERLTVRSSPAGRSKAQNARLHQLPRRRSKASQPELSRTDSTRTNRKSHTMPMSRSRSLAEAEISVQRLIEGLLHRGDVTTPSRVLRKIPRWHASVADRRCRTRSPTRSRSIGVLRSPSTARSTTYRRSQEIRGPRAVEFD